MGKQTVTDEDLELDVQAYYENAGNKSEAARARGHKYSTYCDRLKLAETRLGLTLGKVADGRVHGREHDQAKLPKSGHRRYYLLTCIQNNTHLHPRYADLLTYLDWLNSLPKTTAELKVATFTYNKASYGKKATKRGKGPSVEDVKELWYAPEMEEYICDHSVELAPGLVWCGEQNILPTNINPLSRLKRYNGRKSNIVPHATLAMASVASPADRPAKFNYTTGTITQRNYIQKHAGIVAEQNHYYGAAIACVDSSGLWFVRQLELTEDGIMDIGPDGFTGVQVKDGKVTETEVVEAINWGDLHAEELELWVRNLAFSEDGMLNTHRPRYQFVNDGFSMYRRGHHEINNPMIQYEKWANGQESVEDELRITADVCIDIWRPWCETVWVRSNHCLHFKRWLNDWTSIQRDYVNQLLWLRGNVLMREAVEEGDTDFNPLEWALRQYGCPDGVRFLTKDEGFTICGDIECSLHGHGGPNGSRGTTTNLTYLGMKVNKGHSHDAAIYLGVFSAGSCCLRFDYMDGPGSHSISHIVTYKNGARAIVTMFLYCWRV